MSLPIAISIAGLVVALVSGLLIERQKRVSRFNQAVQETIDTIREGRSCKVAVLEDFPEHEKLVRELLPYLLFFGRRKTETTWKTYRNWYKTIVQAQKQNIFSAFGADWQSEIDSTISCLEALLKER